MLNTKSRSYALIRLSLTCIALSVPAFIGIGIEQYAFDISPDETWCAMVALPLLAMAALLLSAALMMIVWRDA